MRAEISSPITANLNHELLVTQQSFGEFDFRDTFLSHSDCPHVDSLLSTPCRKRGITTCYWLPGPNQIVLRAPHWRIDGFGLVMLSDILLSTLANLVRNGLHVPFNNSAQQQNNQVSPSLGHLISNSEWGRSIGIPTLPESGTAKPTACARVAIRMSSMASEKVASACRAQGVSVTSSINAAIVRATTQFPQDSDADPYAIFAPADLRKSLIEARAKECLEPVGSYVSGLPLRIEGVTKHSKNGNCIPAKSFSTLACELNSFYSQDVQNYQHPGSASGRTVSLLQLAEPYIQRMTKLFSSFPLPGCPYPKTPVISSFGEMDTLIKSEYPSDDNNFQPVELGERNHPFGYLE
ncbi:hypothetical protein GQ44DRAFT_824602 [Phaeosphaeriaceae sp. PMI808]|nr:hypothetical protein GQ44DRAFT_824602 [Phaeosphaeriaceae sp. PMI808]